MTLKFGNTIQYLGLFILVFSLSMKEIPGQTGISFRQYTREHGLLQNSVISIAQDGDGFMWLGTRKGLLKFDGYEFFRYPDPASGMNLPDDDIRAIHYDPHRNYLWVGTDAGLSRLDITSGQFTNYRLGNSAGSIKFPFFYQDSRDYVWTFNCDTLYRLSSGQDSMLAVPVDQVLSVSNNVSVRGMLEDKMGQYWLATNQGLHLIEERGNGFVEVERDQRYQALDSLGEISIWTINRDEKENIWFGTRNNGFYVWNNRDERLTNYGNGDQAEPGSGINRIQSLALTGEGKAGSAPAMG